MPLSPVILGFGREGAMLLPEGWTGLDSRPHSPTEQASTGDEQILTRGPVWRRGDTSAWCWPPAAKWKPLAPSGSCSANWLTGRSLPPVYGGLNNLMSGFTVLSLSP